MRLLTLCLIMLTGSSFTATPIQAQENYWQQFVHYEMDVTLDPASKMLTGSSSILYRNNSPDTLFKFYMHLYPNAYKDPNSIYARDARKFYQMMNTDPDNAGWLKITRFRIIPGQGEAPAADKMTSFNVDDTILEADLPHPLPPGAEMRIELNFESKVRKHSRRAGYRGSQFDFAQWYPKVCVYDENGWNNVPFHMLGEFYGEFGTFDVRITVPYDYIIAATGQVQEGDPGFELVRVDTSLGDAAWQQRYKEIRAQIIAEKEKKPARSVLFHAENVHDFAWVASPDFLYESGEWDGIPIHVLYRSYAKQRWTRVVVERGRRALAWLSEKFGRYPYPQLTITHGLLGGGMEYPMLVMNSSEREGLILHEVGHIYFYGILGNNETREAWLDEGFTSFQTRWYMENRYGTWGYDREKYLREANWLSRKRPALTSRENNRNRALFFMTSGKDEPISKWSYEFNDGMAYTVNAYTKGSIFFEMLRYVVGEEKFARICKEYFRRWKFKHVNEARFKAVCEEVSGMELDWFFDQWLHDTPTVDYALGPVKKTRLPDGSYKTEVEIRRRGDGIMPVEVVVGENDGTRIKKRWDGKDERGVVVFVTEKKPEKVMLDPDNQIMDVSLTGQGVLRLELYPELPRMFYSPADAYVLTWKPGFWYNDIDGLRSGVRFRGHYRNNRLLSLGFWYGAKSNVLDGMLSYTHKMPVRLGLNSTIRLFSLEGRQSADISVQYRSGRYLFQPPQHQLTAGVIASRLKDPAYAESEYRIDGRSVTVPSWSAGTVTRLYAAYTVNPRGFSWQSTLRLRADYANDNMLSDYSFTRLRGEAVISWPGRSGGGMFLRGFAGAFLNPNGPLPLQNMFSAFSASPQEIFENSFTLRSRGGFFPEAHLQQPGGGNLRGYYDQPGRTGKALFAVNLELRTPARLPLISKLLQPLLGSSELTLFFDTGRITDIDDNSTTLSDAGIGFFFRQRLPDAWYTMITGTGYTLRFDIPFWVSTPYENPLTGARDGKFKFRYVLSFQRAF